MKSDENKTGLICVEQYASPIRRDSRQRISLNALGFRKINSRRWFKDTSAVRGAIKNLPHLIRIVE